jgi:hypothetical protein
METKKEYVFDIGHQLQSVYAYNEKHAWKVIEQFAPKGQPIYLVEIREAQP